MWAGAVTGLPTTGAVLVAPTDFGSGPTRPRVVALDTKNPSLASRRGDALIDGWLFAAREGAVDCVWRHGRKVVSEGAHVRRGVGAGDAGAAGAPSVA